MDKLNLVTIGKITKNQGNKGEIRVIPLTDFPEHYELLEWIYLVQGKEVLKKRIENVRFHKQFVVLKLVEIDDLEKALSLRDYQIKISETELLPLPKENYYIYQLIGFIVVTISGESIGKLVNVITTGGTDIFQVEGENKEYLIPFAREIVTEIDEIKHKIVINPIPGLLDL